MKYFKQLVSLVILVIIPFGLVIWIRIHETTGFASTELILYPLVFGGGSIVILYLLKKYFLKEPLIEFNSGAGKWTTDILWGLGLTMIYFILFFVERLTLSNILHSRPNMEMLGLMLDMREDPLLLVIWFGPVLWIGIALYEELIRVFVLTSLWKFSNRKTWMYISILITSLLIGFAHWSQGSYGIVTIAIKSMVACFFFYKYKRFLPLIISHVLYDGLQVGLLLLTYPDQV